MPDLTPKPVSSIIAFLAKHGWIVKQSAEAIDAEFEEHGSVDFEVRPAWLGHWSRSWATVEIWDDDGQGSLWRRLRDEGSNSKAHITHLFRATDRWLNAVVSHNDRLKKIDRAEPAAVISPTAKNILAALHKDYLGDDDKSWTEANVRDLMRGPGNVRRVKVLLNELSRSALGWGGDEGAIIDLVATPTLNANITKAVLWIRDGYKHILEDGRFPEDGEHIEDIGFFRGLTLARLLNLLLEELGE